VIFHETRCLSLAAEKHREIYTSLTFMTPASRPGLWFPNIRAARSSDPGRAEDLLVIQVSLNVDEIRGTAV
jgi:hypothetical protein